MTKRSNSNREPLSKKHPSEFNSWKAMKQRLAKQGRKLHPKFLSFDQFISMMGEKSHPDDTLDRIDHKNPDYAPGNVRWASKSLQSRNRKNTSFLTYTGQKYPDKKGLKLSLTEWAEITQQNASTMRGRKKAGWTSDEIIDGKRAREPKTFEQMSMQELLAYQPWDADKATGQEDAYLNFSRKGENRFEFMLRYIRNHHFQMLREQHRSTAYFMHNERERDEYWSITRSFRGTVDVWGRRPNASRAAWERLLRDHTAQQEKYGRIEKQYAKWQDAVASANAARMRSAAALEKQQELTERHVMRRLPKKSSRIEDADADDE